MRGSGAYKTNIKHLPAARIALHNEQMQQWQMTMTATTEQSPARAPMRDHRIDWLRGLALAMIFINHMPGNWLENWTSRNFGFSDAAELFVLLAGFAAAFAYFRPFAAGKTWPTVRRVFERARTLYLAHLASTLAALVLFTIAAWTSSNPDFLDLIGVAPIFSDPTPGITGLLTGGMQLGYFNILPMYVVLLLLTPVFLWLAARDLRVMLAASLTIYTAAQVAGLEMPNYPEDGGWYFNPFAWQILFAIGLAVGALRVRQQVVPYHRAAYAAALTYVIFAAIWVWFSLGGNIGFGILPDQMATLAKSKLPASRLLHVLALAYVVVYSPLWGWLAKLSDNNVFTRMGRNSLPVFCLGSVLSMVGYIALIATGGGRVIETALVTSGLSMMMALAFIIELGLAGSLAQIRRFKPARRASVAHDVDDPVTTVSGRSR
jgi:hypothetical protein